MIRSTLAVSAGLAVVAVVLASLWIGFGPRPQVTQDKRASAAIPLSQQSRTGLDTNGQAIRTITPGTKANPGTMANPPRQGAGMASSDPITDSPFAIPPSQQAEKSRSSGLQADSAPSLSRGADTTADSDSNQQATTASSVDLNTASVEQLNALGAGMIGKRIIEFRPYTSTDELLTRRVLKRADYDAIKNGVVVH